MREFCTPGSVAGLPGNRYSYATVAIYIPAGSARPERGNKKTNVGLGMILGKNAYLGKDRIKNSIRTLRN